MEEYRYRRRRAHKGMVLRLTVVVLVLMTAVLAVAQSFRAYGEARTIRMLQTQVNELQAEKASLEKQLPTVTLEHPDGTLPYQSLYPEMKVDPQPVFSEPSGKAAYLTFDDGPSANTYQILDALKESGQKATFFIVAKNIPGHEDALRRMAEEGHTVAIHTYSHDYRGIYASVEAYLEDFHQAYEAIYKACGVHPTLFRFPGGSVNAYNHALYQELIAEMLRRGFVYHDWSVSSEDATGKDYSPEELTAFVMEGAAKMKKPVILMHDSGEKKNTAAAVPEMVRQLNEAGYTCAPLTEQVRPVCFGYSS